MKARSKKPQKNQLENQGGKQSNDPIPGMESKTEPTAGEKWKHPDPTIPERKHNPDPTKPEKEEGPYSDEIKQDQPKQKVAFQPRQNPAQAELNKDESVGEFVERDIDDMGITGEEKEQEEDLDEEPEEKPEKEKQMPPGINQPKASDDIGNFNPDEQQRKAS